VPELTVIHINFIRIMINALDRGQFVPPKGSDAAKEIDERPDRRQGAHRAEAESLFSPVINRRGR
jgi:hypothetical protein